MQQIILDYKIRSKDGGIKYSWKLNDEEIIESVFLKFDKKYFGICFSTQAGCKNNCVFCSNSVLGLSRNLTFKEIFQEVFKTLNYNKSKIPNGSLIDIAFMGVGEPLRNGDSHHFSIFKSMIYLVYTKNIENRHWSGGVSYIKQSQCPRADF